MTILQRGQFYLATQFSDIEQDALIWVVPYGTCVFPTINTVVLSSNSKDTHTRNRNRKRKIVNIYHCWKVCMLVQFRTC